MWDVADLARAERLEFADLLDDLRPQQWDAPTLCSGWTVRDVVAHTISYLGQGIPALTVAMVRARMNVDPINDALLESCAGFSTAQLAAQMRSGATPSGAGALYGGRVALIECLIHQQDVRRPLEVMRPIPEQHVRVALNFARSSPVIGGRRRSRGLRLIATDMQWWAGTGPEVRGTGEALLLAMTGRVAVVAAELSGEGVGILVDRS